MTKIIDRFKEPLTQGMSILTLLAFFGFHLLGKIIVETFEINDTMGWKWSVLNTWIDNIPTYSILIFFGIYVILNVSKIKTNLKLSAIHFSLIALIAFLYNFWELDLRITLFFIGISFIVFGMNLYQSLMSRKTSKK